MVGLDIIVVMFFNCYSVELRNYVFLITKKKKKEKKKHLKIYRSLGFMFYKIVVRIRSGSPNLKINCFNSRSN